MAPPLLALFEALPDSHAFHALDPQERKSRTLDAVKRLLLRETRIRPLLLILEDLQWADSETVRCLDAIVTSLPATRICVVLTYRAGYEHRWASRSYYTQLRIDPLDSGSVDALLEAVLGNDASLTPLRQPLIERTEGNPFFIEESIRSLVDTGALIGTRGAYALAGGMPGMHGARHGPGRSGEPHRPAAARRTSTSCSRRPSSARTCRLGCCWPLPRCRMAISARASCAFSRRSSCKRSGSFPRPSTASATASPTRWPMRVSCSIDARSFTRRRSWRWSGSTGATWSITWTRSRAMRSAARSGTRPSTISARRGRAPIGGAPCARRSPATSRRSSSCHACPSLTTTVVAESTCASICIPPCSAWARFPG